MNVTEKQVLRNLQAARDHLVTYGWQTGGLGEVHGPTCADGAIRAAVCQSVGDDTEESRITRFYFWKYGLRKEVLPSYQELVLGVWRWNDAGVRYRAKWWHLTKRIRSRTQGEVVAVFDRAIQELARQISRRKEREVKPLSSHEYNLSE